MILSREKLDTAPCQRKLGRFPETGRKGFIPEIHPIYSENNVKKMYIIGPM